MNPTCVSTRRLLAFAAATLVALPTLASAATLSLRAGNPNLANAARGLGKGAGLEVRGLKLAGEDVASTLKMERFDVWRQDAVIEVDGRRVTPPGTAYFKGTVDGDASSIALLSVRDSGEVQGVVQKGGKSWLVGKGRTQRFLKSRKADGEELTPFECGNDVALTPEQRLGVEDAPVAAATGTVLDQPYIANIALDTDYEFYAKFGNQAAALDYMGDLIGYADVVYSREVNTDMQIGYSRLFTQDAASDPWTATADTSSALTEFRNYWNTNMRSVKRTLAHMLSGKGLGGGIAYVGVLCSAYGSSSSAYDYGVSASLGANFNWDGDQTHNPSTVVWDIVVVQHEIGHNFNSPHTHDYCNIGGDALPIDNCWSGCQTGATIAVPSCTSPTPFFTSGGGAGTIMSYCHQRSGGYGNIAMTFGENHTCGTKPEREAARMASHVVSQAAAYPACFAGGSCGNGVIDAGEQCDGIALGGNTCASQGFAGGTLTCSSTCQLVTSQCTNCGNNVINAGETCDGTALGGGTCSTQGCTGGTLACNATCSGYVKSGCTGCPLCDGDSVCEAGENCTGCPSDCRGGSTSGAVCGNGKCEAGNGEDCISCPSDCNGIQGGKTSGRYCCGDGSGSNPIPCTDSRCTSGGRTCTTVTQTPQSYCCGNATCDATETCSLCSLDCGGTGEVCGNGVDDDCNGLVDCADSVCATAAGCICKATNTSCTANSQCCSGVCRTVGKKRTCG